MTTAMIALAVSTTSSCDRREPFKVPAVPISRAKQVVVREIIQSGVADSMKLTLLRPFVRVGQSVQEVDENLGLVSRVIGHGPGLTIKSYSVGVSVSFTPDGEAYAIGYYGPGRQYVELAFVRPSRLAHHLGRAKE
jgi:hypothetical protein